MGAVFCNLDNPVQGITSSSLRQATEQYARTWWRHDSFAQAAAKRQSLQGFMMDDAFDDVIDRSSDPFFTDFLEGSGLGRFACYFSAPIFGVRYMLSVQRSLEAGCFQPGEIEALRPIAPHVARALAIAGQLSIAGSRDTALLTILDKLTYGAVLIQRRGVILGLNEAATRMLDDGLTWVDGTLVETSGNQRGTIDRLIKAALDESSAAPRNALIHRPSGRKPIVLEALPFPQTAARWETVKRTETVLLLLIDTEAGGPLNQMSVFQGLGLTLAEARVASLIGSGISPTEAAKQLGTAAGTVRVQLKNVFNKLDIKRQSELVRLMAKLEILG